MGLADSVFAPETIDLQKADVKFLACANTLTGRAITPGMLLPGVALVPAAVWHLVSRQHEGWSYLSL